MAKTDEVDVPRRFQQLVDRWSEDTLDMLSIEDMVEHPSYSAIIDMGEAAVPLLKQATGDSSLAIRRQAQRSLVAVTASLEE